MTRIVVLGVGTAIGLLTAIRGVASVQLGGLVPLLELRALPVERLGLSWSEIARWPADLETEGLRTLLVAVALLGLAAAGASIMNALVSLAEDGARKARHDAIRLSVGAAPRTLFTDKIAEVRTLLFAGGTLGCLGGIVVGAMARAVWPGATIPLQLPPFDLLLSFVLVGTILIGARLATPWAVTRGARAATLLRSGARSTEDPEAVFVRKALAAWHVTVASTVVLAGWALARGSQPGSNPMGATDTGAWVVSARAENPEAWPAMLRDISEIPGIEAETLSTPGALVGLGIRDIVVTECGACSRGMMPMPLWNEIADIHAVGPKYFELAGLDLLEGRAFGARNTVEGEGGGVALVNETLANVAFAGGEPLGRRLRIGDDFDRWYTVVGIVENHQETGPGADGLRHPGVYLHAFQHSMAAASLILDGEPESIEAATHLLSGAGVSTSPPRRLSDFREQAAASLRYGGRVSLTLAVLTILIAALGIWMTSLQTVRHQARELSIRRALGASDRAITHFVLWGRLRVAAWGCAGFLFFGLLVVGVLHRTTGMPVVSIEPYLAIALSTTILSCVASGTALREALDVEPGRAID